jgi:hypothetical protein
MVAIRLGNCVEHISVALLFPRSCREKLSLSACFTFLRRQRGKIRDHAQKLKLFLGKSSHFDLLYLA